MRFMQWEQLCMIMTDNHFKKIDVKKLAQGFGYEILLVFFLAYWSSESYFFRMKR